MHKKIVSLAFITILTIYFLFSSVNTQAATPNIKMYLETQSNVVTAGNSFDIAVKLDTNGTTINAVESDITYPKDLLSVTGIDGSNSPFSMTLIETASNGLISIVKGSTTPVQGNGVLITNIHFKALKNGTAGLTFLSTSAAVNNSSNDSLTSSPGLNITINPLLSPSPSPSGSIIKIYAAGQAGKGILPNMQLFIKIKNSWTAVKTWNAVSGNFKTGVFQEFIFNSSTKITAANVRVKFTNDFYNSKTGDDRNLKIDKINIDGVDYQSEASSVYSTGSFTPGNGCAPGRKQTEWLQCEGYFEYR